MLLENGEGVMRVQLCMPDMFRVTKDKCRDFRPDEQWMVIRYDFDPVQYEVRETRQGVAVMTEALTLLVSDSPWRIKVLDRATGEMLYQETDCRLAAEGNGPLTTCVLRPDEHFFGLGERMDQLDLRGQHPACQLLPRALGDEQQGLRHLFPYCLAFGLGYGLDFEPNLFVAGRWG